MTIPFVSVVLPVYNDSVRLEKCLRALENQTYCKEKYEVVVVDNNSTEDLKTLINQFQQVHYVFESKPGSYAARNKGLSKAEGEIFAFIDSDCLPQAHWLQAGVDALREGAADLAGGKVTFTFSSARSPAEIYDSASNMQIKENIESRKVSKTANLFAYRYVFDDIGLFPSQLKSGGDVLWTRRATDANFKLVYAAEAEVFHPARKLVPLLKKQYRVGLGQPQVLREKGQSTVVIVKGALKYILFPPSFENTKALNERKDMVLGADRLFSIWLVTWLCQATTGVGRMNKLAIELCHIEK